MNKIIKTAVGILASTLIPTTNVAADDAANNTQLFDGLYLGIQTSFSRISGTLHQQDTGTSGISFEGLIGYRNQTKADWLFGLEGAIGDRTGTITDAHRDINFDYIWQWSALAGKAFGRKKNNLIYGKLGVGGIQVNANIAGYQIPSHNYQGMIAGIGYEYAMSHRLSLRTEVTYISYDPSFDHIQTKLGLLVKF